MNWLDEVKKDLNNYIWIILGITVFVVGKKFDIDTGLLAGVCIMKAGNGKAQTKKEDEL